MLVTYYSIHQVGSASLGSLLLLFVLTACVCIAVYVWVGVWMCIYPFTYPKSFALTLHQRAYVCVCASLMGDITIAPSPLTVK